VKKVESIVEFISESHQDVDATQIAEVLWLSQFLPQSSPKAQETSEPIASHSTTPSDTTQTLPRDLSHTIIISSPNTTDDPVSTIESTAYSRSSYSIYMPQPTTLPPIRRQFEALVVKQYKESQKILDETRTVEHIASTGLFYPIFDQEKIYDSYFDLHIVVDTNSSMFLWREHIDHFIESLGQAREFDRVRLFELDSSSTPLEIYDPHKKSRVSTKAPAFKQKRVLTLLFSDVVGRAWRGNEMLTLLEEWSKHSLVAIVSMLPKYMWQRTALRSGESRFMKSSRFAPTNADLEAEHRFVEQGFATKSLKIPIIPYDERAFAYLSQILLASKGALIESRVFEEITNRTYKPKKSQKIDAQTKVRRFLNSASASSRELAIYCSVLPLHKVIIQRLIKVKQLGKGMDAFAEFFFGGLLDRDARVELGEYEFYEGVRRELWEYLSMDIASEIFEIVAEVTRETLGVTHSMYDILYTQPYTSESLNPKELALAHLLKEILSTKGRYYQKNRERISSLIDTIHPPQNHFQMGSDDGYDDEKPLHTVTFDYSFEIAKYPVTFEEYDLYCEESKVKKPSDEGWGRGDRPVINVSWEDAVAYCDWLNTKLNIALDDPYRYRLPTDAEWEYACRAGTTTKWSFGDDEKELEKYAWYDKNSKSKTHPVGLKKKNPWGLHDMHGNVWEWCLDDWVGSYDKTPRDGKAYEDTSLERKVLRGGSWSNDAGSSRSAFRVWDDPGGRDGRFGFRLLRTLP